MPDRPRVLPSTAALRAFEAAARHLGFTGAAVELRRTQGAVNHQIRELETRLGVTLFEREARGGNLVPQGIGDVGAQVTGRRTMVPAPSGLLMVQPRSPNWRGQPPCRL